LSKITEKEIVVTKESQLAANKFEAKTGVDLEVYRRPELAEMIGSLVSFPIYAGQYVIIPFLVYLIITIFLAYLVTGELATLLAIIFIPLFSISNALATAALLFLFRLRKDMTAAVSAGLGLTREVTEDLRNVHLKRQNNTLEFPGFGETFKAVMQVVIIPTVIAVIKRKIPLIGGLFAGLIRRIADLATRKTIQNVETELLQTEEADHELSEEGKQMWLIKRMETATGIAEKADRIITQSIKWSSRILIIPVFMTFAFVLSITVFCYYLIF
jgi:hypothetical protein